MMIRPWHGEPQALPARPRKLSRVKSASRARAPARVAGHRAAPAAQDRAAEHDGARSPETRSLLRPGARGHRSPPSRMPARMAADPADDEGERSAPRPRRTPEKAAARGLPPAATSCLPKVERCSKSQPTTPTTRRIRTEYGSSLDDRHVFEPLAPEDTEVLGQRPRGAPPVQTATPPCRMSSIPSVVRNDGTPSLVVMTPFDEPDDDPERAAGRRPTRYVRSGSPSVSPAPATTTTVTIEPTDRSNSPATITKSCPAARIMSGAARLRKARKYPRSVKPCGFTSPMATSRPRARGRSAPAGEHGAARGARHEIRPLLPRSGAIGRSAVVIGCALAAHGVDGNRRDDDHPAQDVLQEGVDLELVKEVVEQGEDEHARDRPEDAAFAAGQRGAAERRRPRSIPGRSCRPGRPTARRRATG